MDSDSIDLKKLSGVFGRLASDSGDTALASLDAGLEGFRSKLGVELNDAEFKYLSSALVSQRSNHYRADVSHSSLRSSDAGANLARGFFIKAKI
ncbi:hypothetical protein OU995_01800 [Roseateles sp. SL47]|uniref:hypothetical protein n=1 Tax=Roseateles sp. SL47 TaxID=2995138 RepID=UPI0022709760|nr:hypothetical protein [Roseateles sp. SL47]WAC73508.1 hypothetical protein OU995_01800 [Roseateles sp. SL47]